ncbi:hypothetical protein [Actinocatenispora rupis]|uniref:Uncharacterized protein n=1 Tax=Actinocatenispora rupis TaxID=519421 RepID=A0A8J3J4G1_9ACTN|nr:hypothetical protein [Actinocatenispora rupis]GID11965.1 hypothetical protein Aru02nite_28540 [Actinocatenispora rupis]
MAPPPDEADIRTICANIDWQWDRLIDRYNHVVDTVRTLGMPGTPQNLLVKCYLKDPLENLYRALNESAKTIRNILAHDTPIMSLVHASGVWIEIERNAALLHRETDPRTRKEHNDDLDSWSDKAATVYRQRIPVQAEAMAAVRSLAGSTSAWLDGVASANLDFLSSISKTVGEAIALIVEAGVDIAEVVSMPKAAGTIGKLCGKLVGELYPQAAFDTLSQALHTKLEEHEQRRAQNKEELVLGGSWPDAVA